MHDDFFRAYGSAMFAWQIVETALFQLYHSLNVLGGQQNIMVSANAYYTKKSFGQKQKLVENIAKDQKVEKFIDDWKSINSNLISESKIRNLLAHRPVCLMENRNGSISFELHDPIFLPLSLREYPPTFSYNTDGCLELCHRFKNLAQRIDAARELIPHKFVNNQLVLPE